MKSNCQSGSNPSDTCLNAGCTWLVDLLTISLNLFNDIDVNNNLADLHKHYVIVPADKASNNVVFVCKTYYFECLQRELDLDDSISTYQRTAFSKDEILANHRSVLSSFAIDTVGKDTDLPLLYWILAQSVACPPLAR